MELGWDQLIDKAAAAIIAILLLRWVLSCLSKKLDRLETLLTNHLTDVNEKLNRVTALLSALLTLQRGSKGAREEEAEQ